MAIVTDYVANVRAKLILKELRKLERSKIEILDVGCGNQYIMDKLKQHNYFVVGLDNNTPATCSWMTREPDFVMDATHMKFKDNSFDVVLAVEVLEHIDCIHEIKRILKPGGLFLCTTPTPNSDWIRRLLIKLRLLQFQDFDHHDNILDLKSLSMRLVKHKVMFLGTSQYGVFINEK